MAEQTNTGTAVDEGVLVIERIFDAPRELVWKAWTDPDQVMRWWGPKLFNCPAAEMDFRVGGKWLFAMQSPDWLDGRAIWGTGVYREIVPFERIVTTDSFADEAGNVVPGTEYGMDGVPLEMLLTVTFEDVGDKTRLTIRHEGLPAEHSTGAGQGWNESLDKMAELLK